MKSLKLEAAYVLALCGANLLIFWLGPKATPVTAFILIGLDLSLRDVLHEKRGFFAATALAVSAAFLSYLINPAASSIAIASAISFAVASVVDGSAYHALRGRERMTKMNGSNVVGSAVDSLVFPTLAFGVLMPEIVALQFAAKVVGGFIWSLVLTKSGRIA